ncbi:MAG: agmatine deiminase family protein [Terrimonas sp.]|nr:agmatine deiminase family protein [Terrimonas sp.]
MPGEFEPQEAVWLGWQAYENYYPVNISMVRSLLPFVKVKIATESDSIQIIAKKLLAENKIDTSQVQFFTMPNNEFWMRDHGAAFIINGKGDMKAVDFVWGTYGYREWLIEKYNGNEKKADSALTKSLASKRGKVDSLMGVAENIPVERSWIRIEGGAIEVNGKGTLLLNEPLTLSRNKGISKDSIAREFKRVLGVKNIIWLQTGLAEDPHIIERITGKYVGIGTGGHTDEYVRFADANTILLAWMPEEEKDMNPVNKINYERMNINYNILSSAKNENGKPFKIIKVPLPDLISKQIKLLDKGNWDDSLNMPVSAFKESENFKAGDTAYRVAAASYLNFYVTNRMVLLPSYISQGTAAKKEEAVKQLFQSAFPGREIIFMDAMPLNWEGGGIHCGTQQQPKIRK